jgi:phosphatidylglycerophosphate synthase
VIATGARLPPPAWAAEFGLAGAGVTAVALAAPVGAPAAALAVGVFGLVAGVALGRITETHPHDRFGAANRVTLARAGGAALFCGLALEPAILADPAVAWIATGAALALLLLDGLDGYLARRSSLASAFGARFDMETDALLILALAALAWGTGKTGVWVLGLGLMRYAFVLAGLLRPRLARPLPPSWRRKAVCVFQIAVLTALLAPVVTQPIAAPLAALAVAILAWSFAIDLRWLERAAR